jgi:hypothetical protein
MISLTCNSATISGPNRVCTFSYVGAFKKQYQQLLKSQDDLNLIRSAALVSKRWKAGIIFSPFDGIMTKGSFSFPLYTKFLNEISISGINGTDDSFPFSFYILNPPRELWFIL